MHYRTRRNMLVLCFLSVVALATLIIYWLTSNTSGNDELLAPTTPSLVSATPPALHLNTPPATEPQMPAGAFAHGQ